MHFFFVCTQAHIRARHTKSAQNYKKYLIYARKKSKNLCICKKSSNFAADLGEYYE